MKLTGEQMVTAPRAEVWEALNDPVVLQSCLPGCQLVEKVGATEFKVILLAAIGPLRARFNGVLKIEESDPPNSCVMVFEGQGGAAGFGKGTSRVELHEADGDTRITYEAQAQVGGKLAQVGSRLIDGVAKKMSDDFFDAFRKHFTTRTVVSESEAGEAPDRALSAAETSAIAATRAVEEAPVIGAVGPVPPGKGAGTEPGRIPAGHVPAWWLGVAAVLGAAIAIISARLS